MVYVYSLGILKINQYALDAEHLFLQLQLRGVDVARQQNTYLPSMHKAMSVIPLSPALKKKSYC